MKTFRVEYMNDDREVVMVKHIQASNEKAAANKAIKQAPADATKYDINPEDF